MAAITEHHPRANTYDRVLRWLLVAVGVIVAVMVLSLGVLAFIAIERGSHSSATPISIRLVANLTGAGAWRETPFDEKWPEDQPLVQAYRYGEDRVFLATTRFEEEEAERVEIDLPLASALTAADVRIRWYRDSEGIDDYARSLSGEIRVSVNQFPSEATPVIVEYELAGARGSDPRRFQGKLIVRAQDIAGEPVTRFK